MAILGIFTLLDRLTTAAISDVGHDDENEEESEGKEGLPLLDGVVAQDDEEPHVSDDGPSGGNSIDTGVLDFLNASGAAIGFDLLVSSLIIGLVDSEDRDTRDDKEVESS